MKKLFAIGFAANVCMWGLYGILLLADCSPAERQAALVDVSRVAVHAAAMDLIEYCKPNDTVADCIDKLIELGIREIKLLPQDGGTE